MASKRNSSIDMFRLAAVALVVIQHYRMLNTENPAVAWMDIYSRVAVPFFFMVSGYFSWKADSGARESYLKKQIVTMAKIFAVSAAVILAFNFAIGLKIRFRPRYLVYLFAFNDPKFLFQHSHLWYILALIYVLAIGLAVEKKTLHKVVYVCVPLFLASNIVLDCLLYKAGIRRSCYTRNFLFDGLPFFYLGQLLRRYEDKILSAVTKKRSLWLFAAMAVCLGLEGLVLMRTRLSTRRTIYISTAPLIFSLFLLLLNFPDIGRGSFPAKYARDASMVMYIVHHMVEEVIKMTAMNLWGVEMYRHSTVRYFLILLFSGIIGLAYAKINQYKLIKPRRRFG